MDDNLNENKELIEEELEENTEVVEEKVVEDKKKSKKPLIIILVILLIAGVGVGAFILGQNSSKDNTEEKDDSKDTGKEQEDKVSVTGKDYVKDNELVKVSNLTGATKLYADGVNAGNDIVIHTGYDGYYVVNKSGTYYLKRNQKEVSKIENYKLKVYKDNSDKNSKYIAVYCNSDYCEFARAVDENYAYLSSYGTEDALGIILNVNTGVNKLYNKAIVGPVEGSSSVIFSHESTETGVISIVSLNDFSLKNAKDVYAVGDGARLAQGDSIYSSSSKYIVVTNSIFNEKGKYGLYDYQMNKKLDFIYDDLNTISDDLLIAKKGKKFGVIDASNKTVIDFNYDGIEAIDDYYVVIKDGKLGVLGKDGKEVVPFNYSVPKDMEFTLRLCCADENSFTIVKKVNQIVISYYDTDKPNDSIRYGYDASYIILNSDNTYSKVDYVDKVYSFSDEFYYYNVNGYDFNLYTKDRTLFKTLTCPKDEAYSYAEFKDKNIVTYSCGFDKDYYYNVNTDKQVTYDDVDKSISESGDEVERLYVYEVDNKNGVYNSNKELLLELEDGAVFRHVHDNIYKVMKLNGNVEYYELKGNSWNY